MAFQRFLDPRFVSELNTLYSQRSWWTKLVDSPNVFLAIRNNYLNAYSRGMSVGRIGWEGNRVSLRVHEEYLTLPSSSKNAYVDLALSEPARSRAVITSCNDYVTHFTRVQNRADRYSGDERRGTNSIASLIASVIDMEAAFEDREDLDPDPVSVTLDKGAGGRLDLVSLSADESLIFIEAKLFTNCDLRARGRPRVCEQLEGYHAWLTQHSAEILSAYQNVLKCYRDLTGLFFDRRRGCPRFRNVLEDPTRLTLCPSPRLLIFDFDDSQRPRASEIADHVAREVAIPNYVRLKPVGTPDKDHHLV